MPYKDPDAKRAWRASSKDKNNAYNRRWHARNPNAQSQYDKRSNQKSWEDGTRFAMLVYKYFDENIQRIEKAHADQAEKDSKHRRKWRARAIAFLGGRCEWCGFDNPMCLEIDHIVPERRRTNDIKGHNSLSFCKAIVRGEEKNAQLLCSNCHTIKTKLNKEYGNGFVSETFDPYKGICFDHMDAYIQKHHSPSLLDHPPFGDDGKLIEWTSGEKPHMDLSTDPTYALGSINIRQGATSVGPREHHPGSSR